MTRLSDTTYYIDPLELAQGMIDGNWKFCRPDFYIRRGVDTKSVEDKKKALIFPVNNDGGETTYNIRVLEPLVINQYENEKGVLINEIISGNTRVRAILELINNKPRNSITIGVGKDASKIDIEEFEPIPYRVFESPIELDEAISFQVSTNDHTKEHNLLDIAFKVVSMKPLLEEKFKAQGMKVKAAQGAATDALCNLFKKTRQNLNQYTTVINKGTDKLRTYVYNGMMSFDSAQTLIQKCDGDPAKIDSVLEILHQKSKQSMAVTLDVNISKIDDSEVGIYKSHITQYFDDLNAAAKLNEKGEESFSDETVHQSPASSETGSKARTVVSREQFAEDAGLVVKRIQTINPDDLNVDSVHNLDRLNKVLTDALTKTNTLFLPSEKAIEEFKLLRQLFLLRCGDVDGLADAIGSKEDAELFEYLKVFSKCSKPSETLIKFVYESSESSESSDNVDEDGFVTAKSEVIEAEEGEEKLVTTK